MGIEHKNDLDIIVETNDLEKSFLTGTSVVAALKKVTLKIKRGEQVAIMGRSGSGKSTLMNILGCLDRPTKGQVLFLGQDLSLLNDQELSLIRATKIGFVFQSFNLIPQLNIYENVEVPFLYQPINRHALKKRILDSIDKVGLSHRMNHLPKELSGGEMQRVAIARALAINPELILADEPTGSLDIETGASILKLFDELNEKGVTLVVVTHDEAVGKRCQRIICMSDGRVKNDLQL